MTFQTIVRETLKREKATHFPFAIEIVCHPCFILPGTAPSRLFVYFLESLPKFSIWKIVS